MHIQLALYFRWQRTLKCFELNHAKIYYSEGSSPCGRNKLKMLRKNGFYSWNVDLQNDKVDMSHETGTLMILAPRGTEIHV